MLESDTSEDVNALKMENFKPHQQQLRMKNKNGPDILSSEKELSVGPISPQNPYKRAQADLKL